MNREIEEKKQLLRKMRLFWDVPDELLNQVVPMLKEISLKPGQMLFEKGSWGTCAYLIHNGRLRIHDGALTFNVLGKGEIVGEMAALDPAERSASVTALEDAVLFEFSQENLSHLLSNDFSAVQAVIHFLSQHLRTSLRDMTRDYRYIRQVNLITDAARAFETGTYDQDALNEVSLREDELGQLARVFQKMAEEVIAREQRLKQQVQALKIKLDEVQQQKQVDEITQTDYFRNLQKRARDWRKDEGEI
jgi:CRP-like cAMP-binding protein